MHKILSNQKTLNFYLLPLAFEMDHPVFSDNSRLRTLFKLNITTAKNIVYDTFDIFTPYSA